MPWTTRHLQKDPQLPPSPLCYLDLPGGGVPFTSHSILSISP
jgi:hypothetical protein